MFIKVTDINKGQVRLKADMVAAVWVYQPPAMTKCVTRIAVGAERFDVTESVEEVLAHVVAAIKVPTSSHN